jgi:D-arginine dehydrogenase
MTREFDILVLGAGMAGASVAAELAQAGRHVALIEIEPLAGRHATARSAATFFESYGNPTVRALTRASRPFFERPPAGFCDAPLMRSRHALFVSDRARLAGLDAIVATQDARTPMRRLDTREACTACPILNADWVAGGVLDTSGHDLDVAAIHLGYLKLGRRSGVELVLDARDTAVERRGGRWHVATVRDAFVAPIIVDAAGAWGDVLARSAGVRTIGLQPLRRTCVTIPAPAGHDVRDWPMVIDVDEDFYFKPDAGQLLVSPANEDLSEPCDAVAEELDIAIAIDRFERATTMSVARLSHRWAGLRSFVADRSPVAGFEPDAPGFFWLVGQGGYGIQMAPALARLAAALMLGRDVPDDIRAQGVDAHDVSPARASLRRG